MRGVATVDELQRDPVGRYVLGETYVHFCAQPGLWGILLWGRPTQAHAVELGRSLVLELERPAQPHVSIIDASRLEGGDAATFALVERYMTKHAEALSRMVKKLALVRPTGFGGAIVSGAYEVMHRPYPVAVFDGVTPALEWLVPAMPLEGSIEAIGAEITGLLEMACGTAPILASLRTVLDANLGGISLADAAKSLGLSERTLQRRLGEASATFQDELADARIRAAKRRLQDGDDPITAIAFDVGCASPQHLNALFRKRTGQSPSAWRKSQRGP